MLHETNPRANEQALGLAVFAITYCLLLLLLLFLFNYAKC